MRLIAIFQTAFVLVLSLVLAPHVHAQTTVTADWTNLGRNSFEAIPNGETLSIAGGVNSVTISTAKVTDGDANDANFTNYYSTDMLSYYAGSISGFSGSLFFSTDHSVFDPGDYFQSVFTLDTAVSNLAFTLGNVDNYLFSPYMHDAVVIQYDTGNGTWQNLRTHGGYTLGTAVGTTTINGQQGFHGTAYSGGTGSTTADIDVDFGSTTVKRLRIRYFFGQGAASQNPAGQYQYMALSDFTWQQSGVSLADLSLNKQFISSTAATGSQSATATFRLAVTNASSSNASASGISVRDAFPSTFIFSSATGAGAFNSTNSTWAVPTLAPGASATIDITGIVTAVPGTTVTSTAEIISSSVFDPDSTPDNGSTSEDDYATASFTAPAGRSAGVPPTLVCSTNALTFDWAGRTWNAGDTSNNYTLAGLGAFNWSISSPAGFMFIGSLGGQHPVLTTAAQNTVSLSKAVDFTTSTQFAITTITLGEVVDGAQFVIFDVDYAYNDFADRVKVYGTRNGGATTVIPILTNGTANYVVGNEAFGDFGSDASNADGNVTVTFNEAIDTIIIEYGNHSLAPDNPDGQAIQMSGGISICPPNATLVATKTSTPVEDPVNGTDNPYNIPGARVRYCLLLSNTGSATARQVSAIDILPADVTYVAGSMMSGTECSAATTPEDDDSSDAAETDPITANFNAGTVSYSLASLAGSGTAALVFDVLVD